MKITLKQGQLIGKKEKSVPSGKTYHSFSGIPYAEPPINLLRFQAPKPHSGWDGVLEATFPGPSCLQKSVFVSAQPFGQEDCLYVNVHVPESTDNRLKPVMIYIHGGGFLNGSGDFYRPVYLMEHDVIVVTFNYRLHVLGFLNLGLPECPGNVGLKDQILLFQWVRENISKFGGDSNNITAVGESAGGACVHFLMISPLGKGLFDRAIIQSGSALCPWAFTEKQTKNAFKLGEILGCVTTNKRELYNFLLEVPAEELSKAARKLTKQIVSNSVSELAFVPSIEEGDDTGSKLLPEHPEFLMKKVIPVPVLTGINDLESLIFITEIPTESLFDICEKENIIPPNLRIEPRISKLNQKIKNFYFGEKIPNYETLPQTVDLLTDINFAYPFHKMIQSINQYHPNIPTFNYQFSYVGELNLHKKMITALYPDVELNGSSHTDELQYLFLLDAAIKIIPDEKSFKMIHTMCNFWTNFIKYGKPTLSSDSLQWDRTQLDNPCYLHIDEEIQMKYEQINASRMKFWDNLSDEARSRKLKFKL